MLMKNLTRLVVTDQAQTPQPKQYFENMWGIQQKTFNCSECVFHSNATKVNDICKPSVRRLLLFNQLVIFVQ